MRREPTPTRRHYDLRTVQAPYLFCAEYDRRDHAAVWHLLTSQPNQDRIPFAVLHTLAHALMHNLRTADPRIVIAGPMGCGTGYYIVALDIHDFDEMARLVVDALSRATEATNPCADESHCATAADHDLTGMQELARGLLADRLSWGSPGPDAELLAPDVA